MSSTQRAAVSDTKRADDELLTSRKSRRCRVPARPSLVAPPRHGPRSFRVGRAFATGARRSSPGSTTRPMATARASSDIMPLADVAPVLTVSTGAPTSSASSRCCGC